MTNGNHLLTLQIFDQMPNSARVRLPIVCQVLGVSKATIWRMTADGRLSRPTKLGGTTGWLVGDVRSALNGGVR